jgi:hypothetical protein
LRCFSTVPSSVSVDDEGSRSLKDGLNEDDSDDDDDDAIRASLASGVVNNRGDSSSFPFLDKLLFSFSFSLSSSSLSPDLDEKNSDKSEIGAGGRAVLLDLLLQCCIILLLIDSDIYYEVGEGTADSVVRWLFTFATFAFLVV